MRIPENQDVLYFALSVVLTIATGWFLMRFFEWLGKVDQRRKDRKRIKKRKRLNSILETDQRPD